MGIFALAKNGEGRSARSGGWKCGHYPRPLMVGRVAHLLCYPRDLAAEGVGFKTEFDIVLLILMLGGALGQCDCCMCDSSQLLFRQGTKIHGNTNTRSFCTTKIIKKARQQRREKESTSLLKISGSPLPLASHDNHTSSSAPTRRLVCLCPPTRRDASSEANRFQICRTERNAHLRLPTGYDN